MNPLRASVLALFALLGSAGSARADWLLTPFAGVAFRTDTGFIDLDGVAGQRHATYGLSVTLFPQGVLGADAAVSWTPSAFTGHDLVDSSKVQTVTGSAIVALPKRWSRLLRPYMTIGVGLLHVTSVDIARIFPIDSTHAVGSLGAGVWLPLRTRLGVRADVRFLRTRSEPESSRFQTWHSTLGATLRF
jgi:hypothetical protein